MAKPFTVYGRANCPWCDRAVKLLETSGKPVIYYDLTVYTGIRDSLIRQGHKTVPAIFRGGYFIGGFEALVDYLHGDANG